MSNKALFLDRDGIVNEDRGYVGNIKDFAFTDGIFECVRRYQNSGYVPVIVTNQSGIGRGFYSEVQFRELCDWMNGQFELQGVGPLAVYYCPHHPHDAMGEYRRDCHCRKPRPGMLLTAAKELKLNLAESVMVGDSWRDMQAADAAGVKKLIWVNQSEALQPTDLPVIRVDQVKDVPLLT
ncbi:D-glycero-beta-D-manno-heptose 1,7-bisphosphate 7-phosphatase [Alteromonas aestuariivivens]|uniref:D,D-heptose 1,7-bisphosphate phosphatase n=1 Tax=Alteromonas aestuariivivens TaxID=1938339 RepID=A0A3D8M8U6_9ALTE|nr:D-glycero-beta-D-manno-heptose 1,7-bisphosphate 7-phosphatase [Alteromonas aestuariivivens]RDV26026.1 D-glycero-beta-D-manno-heptose 1,7-bisphosphate 7-phosphatase [Alteromonas aestuariivivens]